MKRIYLALLVAVALCLAPAAQAQDGLTPIDAQGRWAEADFVRNGVPWNFEGILGALTRGAMVDIRQQQRVDLAEPTNVSKAYLAVQAAHAADLPDGIPVGVVAFHYGSGEPTFLLLVTGSTIAEWALEDPSVEFYYGGPGHQMLPDIVYEYEDAPPGAVAFADQTFTGYCYQTDVDLDFSRTLESIILYLVNPDSLLAFRHPANPEPSWLGVAIQGITLDTTGLVAERPEETNQHAYQLIAHSQYGVTDPDVYDTPGIGPAAMTKDGEWLAWISQAASGTGLALNISRTDGSDYAATPLPEEAWAIWETVAVTDEETGEPIVFLLEAYGSRIYRVVNGEVAEIVNIRDADFELWNGADLNITQVDEIETTSDGDWVYCRVSGGYDRGLVIRLTADRTPGSTMPEVVLDYDDIPAPVKGGQSFLVQEYAVSGDGELLAGVIGGYYDADGVWNDDDEIFVKEGDAYTVLTNDSPPIGKMYLALSEDGSTMVYHAAGEWHALSTSGEQSADLAKQPFNLLVPSLTEDGEYGLFNLGDLIWTNDGTAFDLFPWPNVATIPLGITWGMHLNRTGDMLSFVRQVSPWPHPGVAGLYVGRLHITDEYVETLPIGIESVSFSTPTEVSDPEIRLVIEVETRGPVERVSLDPVADGVLVAKQEAAIMAPFAPHDDGVWPDRVEGDGIFTTWARIREGTPNAFRVGVATEGFTWVVIRDLPIPTEFE